MLHTLSKPLKLVIILILSLLSFTGCRPAKGVTATRVDNPHHTPSATPHSGNPLINNKAEATLIIKEAKSWLGTPYKYGEAEKGIASDCSGMVMKVFEKALCVKIPRNSAKQAEFCIPINKSEAHAGDLVFFATGNDSTRVTHVGILTDDGCNFIHVSSTRGTVISSLSAKYYTSRLLMYGRVPSSNIAHNNSASTK